MALRLSGLHVFIQFVILMSETKNELETLLEQAATEPAHRPAFFRTLLESTVWVPGTAAEGEAVVEDSALDLQHWEKEDGTTVIPFFTSPKPCNRRLKMSRHLSLCRCVRYLK